MVWPFSSSSDNGGSNSPAPPQLDPQLQQFLNQEKPAPYKPASTSSSTSQPTPTPPPPPSTAPQTHTSPSGQTTPLLPDGRPAYARKSAFTDGRYDHLWATYRSREDIESSNKTDAEKTSDLIDTYRQRNATIKTAAMENCSGELLAQWDCSNGNNVARRLTMCREETRQIGRCLTMQGRFLRALGYASEYGRAREVEEDIQLHADDLYRRMRVQERLADEAREQGREEPVFPNLVKEAVVRGKGGRVEALQGQTFWPRDAVDSPDDPALPAEAEGLRPNVLEDIKNKLKPLTPMERAMERASIANEITRATNAAETYDYLSQKIMRERQERRDAGTASVGDRVAGIFGR